MAKGDWWFKFDFRIWRTDPSLRRCSIETRGFWLEVLCVMYETSEYSITGTYEELARLVGCETNLVARSIIELERNKTCDVTLCNDEVTLVSRRLQKEASSREKSNLRVEKFRGNGHVTPVKRDRVISKSKEKEKKEEENNVETTSDLVVFEHWKTTMNHPTAKFTKERKVKVKERLKSYTIEEICKAIDGCKKTPHNMGQNNNNTIYDDLELICRNDTNLERFMGYAQNGNGKPVNEDHEKAMEILRHQREISYVSR